VLTIGNFDGVHRGHQALLQGLRKEGKARGLPVVVMIFEPQPLELFAGDKSPARLTRLRENYAIWRSLAWITCCVYVSIVALPR
jgi:riboflavin kinase/FMN adenylyltransferase